MVGASEDTISYGSVIVPVLLTETAENAPAPPGGGAKIAPPVAELVYDPVAPANLPVPPTMFHWPMPVIGKGGVPDEKSTHRAVEARCAKRRSPLAYRDTDSPPTDEYPVCPVGQLTVASTFSCVTVCAVNAPSVPLPETIPCSAQQVPLKLKVAPSVLSCLKNCCLC
jgi:hypothetical protein